MTLPVIKSTSSIVKLYFSVSSKTLIPDITPILFPINPGVSLHRTVCFPKTTSPKSIKKEVNEGSVSV